MCHLHCCTQARRAGPTDFADEKRVELTITMAGKIQSVVPAESMVFGWPASSVVGCHVLEIVDVFSEWKERSGSDDMQLILLALLDKEHEMPGTVCLS